METWMVVIAVIVLVLPLLLMFGLNGTNQADSRGRRISRRWRTRH